MDVRQGEWKAVGAQAPQEWERFMRHAPGLADEDRVAAFVTTHLQRSRLLSDAAQVPAAVAYLCGAHRTLMALVRDGAMPAALQSAACRHCRETRAALLRHVALHGADPEIADTLREDRMLFPWHGAVTH